MTDEAILQDLLSGTPDLGPAWKMFLGRFSNLLLKIVWQFEKDYDEAMEKYLFVCRKLAENDFARLRRFQHFGEQAPQFTTWLAAVAHNLCIDSHRARHGRRQLPRAILILSELDREVFRLYYWKGYSFDETAKELEQKLGKTSDSVGDSLSRIRELVSGAPHPKDDTPVALRPDEDPAQIMSHDPDVELEEMLQWLEQWIGGLTHQEQLIIRLRFWENLTGPEIAKAMRISPEQKVYPLLQKAIDHLREQAVRVYAHENPRRASVSHTVKGQDRNAS